MSRWGKPIKNKKRFDARYFMSEREERIDEIHPGDPGIDSKKRDRKEPGVDGAPFPGGSIEDLPPISDDILQQEKEKALATKLGLPWKGTGGPNKMEPGDFDWDDVVDEVEAAQERTARATELEET
jgi:hypothetical protein